MMSEKRHIFLLLFGLLLTSLVSNTCAQNAIVCEIFKFVIGILIGCPNWSALCIATALFSFLVLDCNLGLGADQVELAEIFQQIEYIGVDSKANL